MIGLDVYMRHITQDESEENHGSNGSVTGWGTTLGMSCRRYLPNNFRRTHFGDARWRDSVESLSNSIPNELPCHLKESSL